MTVGLIVLGLCTVLAGLVIGAGMCSIGDGIRELAKVATREVVRRETYKGF